MSERHTAQSVFRYRLIVENGPNAFTYNITMATKSISLLRPVHKNCVLDFCIFFSYSEIVVVTFGIGNLLHWVIACLRATMSLSLREDIALAFRVIALLYTPKPFLCICAFYLLFAYSSKHIVRTITQALHVHIHVGWNAFNSFSFFTISCTSLHLCVCIFFLLR